MAPYFLNRNEGWWSLPKVETENGEEILDEVVRKFKEEICIGSVRSCADRGYAIQKTEKKFMHWGFKKTGRTIEF